MSDEDLLELDELVGDWADAASQDDVDEELLALDDLADEWAKKVEDEDIEDDWAGRKPAAITSPPDPEEPITLPKRPDPVTLPPLPEGDFSDEAIHGDDRYASPMAAAASAARIDADRSEAIETKDNDEDEDSSPVIGAGIVAGSAALAVAERVISANTPKATSAESKAEPTTEPRPEPAPQPTPAPPPIPQPATSTASLATEKAAPRTEYAAGNDDEPVWQRWLPVGLIAGAGVAWLAIMAMTGQRAVDETAPTRVIEQAARVGSGTPVQPASATSSNTVANTAANTANPNPVDGDPRPPETNIADTKPQAEQAATHTQPKPNAPENRSEPQSQTSDPSVQAAGTPNAADAAKTASNTAPDPKTIAELSNTVTQPVKVPPSPEPAKPAETAKAAKPKPAAPKQAAPKQAVATSTKPATSAANANIAARITAPTRPAQKPRVLTATPATSPRVKPVSVNQSIERLEPRRAAARATPLAQRQIMTGPARSNAAFIAASGSPQFDPLTAVELLQDDAAKGARTISTPSATARFNADVKRALQSGADGSALPLTTPDGRLLALRIVSSADDQIRSMSIPRSPLVVKPSSRMVLEGGHYRTREQVNLRAGPSEGTSLQLLARGVLLESIGTMGDSEWKLVGQQGRALGYLKAEELTLATDGNGGTSVSDSAKTVLFDVAKVRTRCRDAQYAINGGGSGEFRACRVYGGEWVLERGGDVTALSPGRLLFKR